MCCIRCCPAIKNSLQHPFRNHCSHYSHPIVRSHPAATPCGYGSGYHGGGGGGSAAAAAATRRRRRETQSTPSSPTAGRSSSSRSGRLHQHQQHQAQCTCMSPEQLSLSLNHRYQYARGTWRKIWPSSFRSLFFTSDGIRLLSLVCSFFFYPLFTVSVFVSWCVYLTCLLLKFIHLDVLVSLG